MPLPLPGRAESPSPTSPGIKISTRPANVADLGYPGGCRYTNVMAVWVLQRTIQALDELPPYHRHEDQVQHRLAQ